MRFLHIFTVLLFAANPALAQVSAGETIPHQLSAMDQDGSTQDFDKLVGKQGLVALFVRSADWCPYCKNQLKDINQAQDKIQGLGYNVVSVSYDSVATLEQFSKKEGITYPMLSDPGSEIIKAFGILNKDMKEGSRFYGVPNPAIYVIDKDGAVQAVLAEESYKDRPSIEAILEALKPTQTP